MLITLCRELLYILREEKQEMEGKTIEMEADMKLLMIFFMNDEKIKV